MTFFEVLKTFFMKQLIYNVGSVSSVQKMTWFYIYIYIYIYTHLFIYLFYIFIPFWILFHYRLLQDIEYSSLCSTIGLCWLSISYIVLYMF